MNRNTYLKYQYVLEIPEMSTLTRYLPLNTHLCFHTQLCFQLSEQERVDMCGCIGEECILPV